MFVINESGANAKLILIDPKTGVNWAADLVGPSLNGYPRDEDGNILLPDDEFKEILDLLDRYQQADNALYESGASAQELIKDIAIDINDYPDAVINVLRDAGMVCVDCTKTIDQPDGPGRRRMRCDRCKRLKEIERASARKIKFISEGRCAQCGHEQPVGRLCTQCKAKASASHRIQLARYRAEGRCNCSRPAEPGKKSCKVCLSRAKK